MDSNVCLLGVYSQGNNNNNNLQLFIQGYPKVVTGVPVVKSWKLEKQKLQNNDFKS